jgi:hypothetical protein
VDNALVGALVVRAVGVVLGFAPLACSRACGAGGSGGVITPEDAALATSAGRVEPRPTTDAAPGAIRRDAAPAPLTPEETSHARAYLEAMRRDRKATVAKTYAEAIAAFDGALREKPGDAQALAERGYAELLDDELGAAEADLKEARASARARPLASQIEYNLGLIAKKQGKTDWADALFAHAKAIRAGADAGPPPEEPCDVLVDYGPLSTEDTGTREPLALEVCASWKACFDRVAALVASDGDSWAVADGGARDDDRAKEALLGAQAEPQGAWLVDTGISVHLLARRPAPARGFVLVPRLERHGYYRCGDSLTSATAGVEGGLVRVDAVHTQYTYGLLCLYENDAGDVTPGECDSDRPDVPMQSYCPSTGYAEFTTTFFDAAAVVARLRVTQTDEAAAFGEPKPEVTFEATAAGIAPAGAGCKDTIPLSDPAAAGADGGKTPSRTK